MKFRLEFIKPGSGATSFKWVLHLAKKFPSFRQSEDEGVTIYSLEFEDKDLGSFMAVYDFVRSWKGNAIFIDDKLFSTNDALGIIYDIKTGKRLNPKTIEELIDQIQLEKTSPKVTFDKGSMQFNVEFPDGEEDED